MWSSKNSGKTVNIDGKSGNGNNSSGELCGSGNYICGPNYTDKGNGNCVKINNSYFSNKTQGGGYSTSGTSGGSYSVGSYNSTFLSSYSGYGNSQGLGKLYEPEEVLGMSGHTKKNPYGDSETIDQIIEFSRRKSADCWGSNALNHGSGGKDGPQYIKAINLGGTDMHDRDSGNLFYVLRDFNFNLEILNLSNNRIGDLGVESMIYGITSLQYQTLYSADNGWKPYQSNLKTVQSVITINLSNNQIGDKGAYILAEHLAKGNFLNLNSLNVSDNQISATGYGYLANSLKAVSQDLKIVFETVKGFSKDALKASMKGMLFIAKNNGISTKETLTTDETIEHCKNGVANVGLNIGSGVVKCTITPLKYFNLKDVTLQDIGLDILSYLVV